VALWVLAGRIGVSRVGSNSARRICSLKRLVKLSRFLALDRDAASSSLHNKLHPMGRERPCKLAKARKPGSVLPCSMALMVPWEIPATMESSLRDQPRRLRTARICGADSVLSIWSRLLSKLASVLARFGRSRPTSKLQQFLVAGRRTRAVVLRLHVMQNLLEGLLWIGRLRTHLTELADQLGLTVARNLAVARKRCQHPHAAFAACGAGSPLADDDCRVYLTATGAGMFTVPTDWNSASNTVEVIGGGGGGATQKKATSFVSGNTANYSGCRRRRIGRGWRYVFQWRRLCRCNLLDSHRSYFKHGRLF
jgi:hypothetical protein